MTNAALSALRASPVARDETVGHLHSHPDRISRKPDINVLKCSSHRATRSVEANELLLDQADGLDWPTLCACDLIFAVDKAELTDRRGSVTPARRRAIVSHIIQSFAWNVL